MSRDQRRTLASIPASSKFSSFDDLTNHDPMPLVLSEKRTPQITVLTLNRPERRNALTIELLTELMSAIHVASEEPPVRILILQGAGAAFCTGLDFKEAADQAKAHATAEAVANTLITISETHLVTIAA